VQTIDVNLRQQPLGHIDARRIHALQRQEVSSAIDTVRRIAAILSKPGLSYEIKPFTDGDAILHVFSENNPNFHHQVLLPADLLREVDYALSDPHIDIDVYDASMTRHTAVEDTDADRISGFIHSDENDDALLCNERILGDPIDEWRHDTVVTILTGIHPTAGEYTMDRRRARQLIEREDFQRYLDRTDSLSLLPLLLDAIDRLPDEPSVDEEEVPPPPRHGCYPAVNQFSHLMPPPAPEDCTPPGAVRPRPNTYQRGISMDQGDSIFEEDPTIPNPAAVRTLHLMHEMAEAYA